MKLNKNGLTYDEWKSLRDFYLNEIDEWQSGDKATMGQPVTGEAYALVMQHNITRLDAELDRLGPWGVVGKLLS